MAPSFKPDRVDVKGLEKLAKALKLPPPKARIGILAGKDARSDGSAGNAEIGAAHEYGAPGQGIPQRSFLRMPLINYLQEQMEKAGLLSELELKEVIKTGTMMPYMRKVATIAEMTVLLAFDSGGFGQWPEWKNPNYTNNTGKLLMDTQQLRNSITSEVKNG
jgi:phage gpG-like protein